MVRAGMRFVPHTVVLNAYKLYKPDDVVFGYQNSVRMKKTAWFGMQNIIKSKTGTEFNALK